MRNGMGLSLPPHLFKAGSITFPRSLRKLSIFWGSFPPYFIEIFFLLKVSVQFHELVTENFNDKANY